MVGLVGKVVILLHPNDIHPLISRTMQHPPSAGQASVGFPKRRDAVTKDRMVWTIEDRTPEPILNKHDTHTWPREPTLK